MIFALQAILRFATITRRDNVVSALQSRIDTKPRWGSSTVAPLDDGGLPGCVVEVRFISQADLDDAYTFLAQRASQQQGAGRIFRHNCRHDEGGLPCQVAAEVVV